MTTPPGWYPEPGHTGNGPALERWWDGSAWSEYTRTAQAPAAQPAAPGTPPYAGYPGGIAPGPPARRGGVIAIGIVAVLVLVGGVVAGVVMLNKSGGDKASGKPSPSSSASRNPDGGPSGAPGGPSQNPGPTSGSGVAVDTLDKVGLPILPGWQGKSGAGGAGLTTGSYKCPADPAKNCVRGGVFSAPAAAYKLTSTTPEAAAKEDIPVNAEQSYEGGLTSHKELLSQPVTVAGQQGYLVRWQVVTKVGDDGYVQSLVFPSPANPQQLVVVRYGFDINAQAPGLDIMDRITKGIKAASGSGGTGGTGV
ncbi:DUF2510 domain-containing protein [Streptomyces sp. H10-C2]|uniref:DUF2510 domain-containing protein n=1 Tax=unclassified Streptomyces TaxID=2593676 RepID=UPI0024B8D313|nr:MULTISPECIES: DUF2510 domain-containing protein [unclassified Streptomyces]MDJ0343750.1 DUF2510 domain-containing protein [Streptomyces sp. PH10-H1]MDJ0373271.1 DUF2510 domain-containing protein [Streptomyces sp. H10-C2]